MECACSAKAKQIALAPSQEGPFQLEKATSTIEKIDINQALATQSVASQYETKEPPVRKIQMDTGEEKEIEILMHCPQVCKNPPEKLSFLLSKEGINSDEYIMVPGPIYVPRDAVTFPGVAGEKVDCCDSLETYSTIHNKADHVEHTTSLCSDYKCQDSAGEQGKPKLPELKSGVIMLYEIVSLFLMLILINYDDFDTKVC